MSKRHEALLAKCVEKCIKLEADLEWQADCTKALLEAQERYVARIAELETAIRKHRDNFPDEALEGEIELWQTLEEDK